MVYLKGAWPKITHALHAQLFLLEHPSTGDLVSAPVKLGPITKLTTKIHQNVKNYSLFALELGRFGGHGHKSGHGLKISCMLCMQLFF